MTLFRASPETEALVRRLRQARENGEDRISYEELSRVANTDVQVDRGYGFMATARSRVQEEDGAVWACERGRGLYLVPHPERARIGEQTAKKMRRAVHRDRKKLQTTDFTELRTNSDQDAFNISMARLLVMGRAASRQVGNRIAAKVEEVKGITDLSLNKALDLMRGAYPNRANPAERSEPETPEEPEAPEGNPGPAPTI